MDLFPTPYLRSVTLRNYKSIAACKLKLPALGFFVGPNGSGKSNFLDSLGFVADALETSLDHAWRWRGGITDVVHRSERPADHFSIRIEFSLSDSAHGHFSFQIGVRPNGGYEVRREECKIGSAHYAVASGQVIDASFTPWPACLPDRLYLVSVSGTPEFRPVFDALSQIRIYNPDPKQIALMRPAESAAILRGDGSNLKSVLRDLPERVRNLTNEYLGRIVPGLEWVGTTVAGRVEVLEFRWSEPRISFWASSMSDGTLRALGILVAIFQAESRSMIVGIEEPEAALHPAALSVLLAALRAGSRKAQILVTSHSPDLLDNSDIPPESIFAVDNRDGVTRIGQLDPASKQVLREKLFTPGELLRQNQLAPDPSALADIESDRQLGLFDFNSKGSSSLRPSWKVTEKWGAVPVLVRRLVTAAQPNAFPQINPPIRVNSGSFLKDPAYLRRYAELAASKAAQAGRGLVLILLDCEDDCPGQLGPSLLARARQVRPDVPCLVALACREYETWFLAAAASLRSHRGLPADLDPPTEPEALRDAKGWLNRHMKDGYDPVADQAAFTSLFDIQQAAAIPSFKRLADRLATYFQS